VENITKQKLNDRPNESSAKSSATKFTMAAAQIGKGIFDTASKLSRLAKLAKKKTLFDDPSLEIQELTYIIKMDITNLNKQIENLQLLVAANNNQTSKHSETVIGNLKSKLANTAKDFRDVLEVRTLNLKEQQRSRMEFTGSPTLSRRATQKPFYEDQPENNGEVSITMPLQELVQQDYTRSRLDAVQSIQGTIIELQGMFTQLANLVVEQGEMITRIDADIDDASHRVEEAQNQLLKFYQRLTSNRSLTIKIFLVLIIFVVLFVVFFV